MVELGLLTEAYVDSERIGKTGYIYIIDDAGISFAYSRSLAGGFGLVSQPGKLPVEGYSNFTWVLLMAPFFAINSFDPILTPKIISQLFIPKLGSKRLVQVNPTHLLVLPGVGDLVSH